MKISPRLFLTFIFLAGLLAIQPVRPAYAASIVVNSNTDSTISTSGDTFCTLREAISNANGDTDTTSGDCTAGSSTDTITFHSWLSGATINLQSTITISSSMTIDGSALASQITISGDSDNNGTGDVRVFLVSSGATATLNGLTIEKGTTSGLPGGGGIYNDLGSALTLTNSTIADNSNSSGPGGGIRNDGTLTVTNSTFSGNTATTSGGGIRNIGALTVTNSTFSGNSAGVTGSGGGIYNVSGFTSVAITNSTFSGNAAGSQGGGIFTAGGTFNYANTIIANSTSGGDCATDGTVGININNLVENGGCSATLSGDPALDSLADNGGPNLTFALISGSSAIDGGDDTTCAASPVSNLDQRGVTRPVGASCDIGAYEGSIADTVAPSVTAFAATSPTASLDIPITSFTTSDNVAVSAYLITQTNTQPSASDPDWTGLFPSTYTVSSVGDYTLYPWAKDPSGNVSSVYGSPAAVNVCYSSVTVTSSADSGAGSLRQAISDACVGATIDFDSSLSGGTIHLASTLTLSKNLTIDGSALASQITISGDNAVRVFLINSSVTTTLNSLAITNGSDFSGGGVRNQGTLTITNSTLSNNAATSGGGIFNTNSGTLTVSNSTLSGNTATSGGGGIHSQGMLTVTNSTLSGNSASGSGGGIYNNGGTLNYINTIIANSTTGGDCVNGGTGTIGTNTNNLAEDASCSAALSGDPNLGALADNGGPTQTFALLTGSPAINAGDNTTCAAAPVNALDQRGVVRPQGGQCDIGAFEYQSTVTSNANAGAGTLRQAIADVAAGDTIIFDPSLSGVTIYLSSTLNINQNMTIDGSALTSKITISGDSDNDGTGDVRVLFIHSGMTVTLDSLNITKGNGTALSSESLTGGGGIQNNTGNNPGAGLTVINSVISGNSADNGGGIFNSNGSTLTITNSTISGNSATNGGGIYSDGSLLAITNSTLSGNAATGGDGGGVRNASPMTLTNSTLSGNSATGNGGGIFNDSTLTSTNSTISGNSAGGSGGGIYSSNFLNYANTIIANSITNSVAGGDCTGDVGINTNNLVEYGGCSTAASGDPMLDSLADNGGPTQTLALILGSPAINAGDDSTCSASPVNNLDQRGVTRPVGANCDIGAYEGAKDITAPTVNSFTATSPSSSLNIPITAFTASDNVAVTDYKITETATPPSAGAAGWTGSFPSTYTVGSDGSYTLYPWAKDAAGNVSAVYGSPASVTVDTTAPTVSSSIRAGSSLTNAASVDFTVTFSESVTGVDTTDFTLTTTGVSGASVTNVSGSGVTRTVSVNTGSGDGSIRLDVPNTASITDLTGNSLSSLPYTSGESYTIDKTTPTVVSVVRTNSNPTNALHVNYHVTFSEAVTNVYFIDFSPTLSGASIVGADTSDGIIYGVTVNTGSGNGTLRLDVLDDDSITDNAGNKLNGPGNNDYTSGETYTVDKTAPTVSITRVTTSPTAKASVQFLVTFSESVTGITTADFSLTKPGITGGSITSVSADSGTTRTVTVNTGSGNGTIRLDIPNTASINDLAGNALSGLPFTSGETYTINKTLTFTSSSSQDGWILESTETSNTGGTLNTTATTFNLGDDASKKQYRGILSFKTSSIPDNATITGVMLKLTKQNVTGGGNPVSTFLGFMVDVKQGFFGTAGTLQTSDFQAAASKTVGPFSPSLSSNTYTINLANAKTFINKLTTSGGLTQIRLRFKLDDNNNTTANYLSLFSGNAGEVNRPQLVIKYYIP